MRWGTIVVDEQIFPIIGVQLMGGEVVLWGRVVGPHPGFQINTLVDMSVFGEDGQEVLHVKHEVPAVPPVEPGAEITIRLPVKVERAVTEDGTS